MIKYKSNISIVFPEKLWKELDFLLRCKNIQNNKKQRIMFFRFDLTKQTKMASLLYCSSLKNKIERFNKFVFYSR